MRPEIKSLSLTWSVEYGKQYLLLLYGTAIEYFDKERWLHWVWITINDAMIDAHNRKEIIKDEILKHLPK